MTGVFRHVVVFFEFEDMMTRFLSNFISLFLLLVSIVVPASAQSVRYTQINPPSASGGAQAQSPYQGQVVVQQAAPSSVQTKLSQALKTPQTILDELKQTNQIPAELAPTIKVSESDTLNAATDGRSIVITSALLNRLDTNDQRAFVISHELAHVVLSHIGQTQLRRTGLSLLDSRLLRRYVREGSLADVAKNLGIQLYDKRSSRVYEYEADDAGIQLMVRSGYNPQAALEVFNILKAATAGNRTPEFLQSHPITESRVRALAQKYQLSPNVP